MLSRSAERIADLPRRSNRRWLASSGGALVSSTKSLASEVSQRLLPRVLLADEVGLGKTIEACLILRRLHLNGQASRILVLLLNHSCISGSSSCCGSSISGLSFLMRSVVPLHWKRTLSQIHFWISFALSDRCTGEERMLVAVARRQVGTYWLR